MSFKSRIIIHHLYYKTPDEKIQFEDLSLELSHQKIGLIGRNGIGKTTLLKLITGGLQPNAGSIESIGQIAYCPQEYFCKENETVAQFLGCYEKLAALERISAGSVDEKDFNIVDNDWTIQEKIIQQLSAFDLQHLPLHAKLNELSGGEKTRLLLSKTFSSNTDFIILDEPTNNLDAESRQKLYNMIQQSEKGFLIVSHDRTLLNFMEQILELTTKGLKSFGGNYDDYVKQKSIINNALHRQLDDAKKQIRKTVHSIQKSRESFDKRKAQGMKKRRSGSQPKMCLNAKRDRSERTQNTLSSQANHLKEKAETTLKAIKKKIEFQEEFKFDLARTAVQKNKMVLEINDLSFHYGEDSGKNIIQNFNLKIAGPDRVAMIGNNGCGKTTLLKLICGILKPQKGEIKIGVNQMNYLDQHVNFLDPNLSGIENFMQSNPNISLRDAHFILAKFLFRNEDARKRTTDLSGGEKIRAGLACILMSKHPPQLLILDEPINHLDIDSIKNIESALRNYQGALLAVSHDKQFLENINIEKFVRLA